MKTYVVGGAVRDQLLGLPVRDRDHVVVGATVEDMEQAGFKPVGRDFPVFLHPVSHEEYALARTERKVARGYKGFTVYAAPDVTLEDDLARRDLTINAMAREEAEDGGDPGDGALVDPYGGQRDLAARLLRHVSPAFVEDPVRILRVARFAARFDFAVADDTLALMRRMVDEGEADALVPERVWQEVSKGLMEPHPGRLFQVLASCGLLGRLFAECGFAFAGSVPANDITRTFMAALDCAAAARHPLDVRFALLAFTLPTAPGAAGVNVAAGLNALVARLRATNDCRDAAMLALTRGPAALQAHTAGAAEQLALLEAADAFRRPARLAGLLDCCECQARGAGQAMTSPWPPRERLMQALRAAQIVDAAAIAKAAVQAGTDIAAALREARVRAIAEN